MRGGLVIIAAVTCLASCEVEDPSQLRSGSPLRRRTSSAKAVVATGTTEAEKCFKVINAYREQIGAKALKHWTKGESCADDSAKSDAASNTAHGSFPNCGEFAQNECPSYPSSVSENLPECLADMWAEGRGGGHYDNMASSKYTEVACGIHELPNGDFWSVQNFR